MKKLILFLIGILLVILLFWRVDFSQSFEALKEFNIFLLIVLCLLQLLTIFLINLQWYKIASYMGEKIPLKDLLYINMVGSFIESITPSAKSGGEAVKVYLFKRLKGVSLGKATALVGIQKIVSFIAFVFLNIISILWFLLKMSRAKQQIQVVLLSLFFLIGFLLVFSVFIIFPSKFIKLINKLPFGQNKKQKLYKFISNFEDGIKEFKGHKIKIAYQLLLALIIWLLFPYKAYLIAKGLDINLSFITIGVVTYFTYMVGMLPLLPGGIGTFEASMVFFLLPMGISPHKGMALALILRFITFWLVFIISGIHLSYNWLVRKQLNTTTIKISG